MSSNTHTQSEENAHTRERQLQIAAKIIDDLTKYVEKKAARVWVQPVNVEIDERGANPRFTITILVNETEAEPGIKKLRRYP